MGPVVMVHAGEMRHQVQLQARSAAKDTAGEPVNTWNVFATVRAAMMRTPGKEIWASAERAGRVPVVFRIRYLDGVLPAMRLLFDGKVHNILSAVDPDGRKLEMVLTTEEWVEETP